MRPRAAVPEPRFVVLDAGALIALENGDERVRAALALAAETNVAVAVPAGVVAQVWRSGTRQARVARLLADPEVTIVPLDEARARAAGALCGLSSTSDVIDASVVVCAHEHGNAAIITSDPDDLARLDPKARLVRI